MEQAGPAGPCRRRFPDGSSRRFAAPPHSGRGRRPAARQPFVGRVLLRDGKFEIEQGKLQTPGGIYQLGGTASMGRVLDVKLTREGAQRLRHLRHFKPASRGREPDSGDPGRAQTMKARCALLLAVTSCLFWPRIRWRKIVLLPTQLRWQASKTSWNTCRATEHSRIRTRRPQNLPNKRSMLTLPPAMSSSRGSSLGGFSGTTGGRDWDFTSGFRSIKAGKNSYNPMLSIFSGVHDVVVYRARLGRKGTGHSPRGFGLSRRRRDSRNSFWNCSCRNISSRSIRRSGVDSRFALPARVDAAAMGYQSGGSQK